MTQQHTQIGVFALGGTIAMVAQDPHQPAHHPGVVPGLSAEALINAIPGLTAHSRFTIGHAETIATVPSPSLDFAHVYRVAERIRELYSQGVLDAAVVTQGTDTLEESAFLFDLLLGDTVPVVLTGAMRNPLMAGADGPANVLAALQTACALHQTENHKRFGALVAIADEIHTALEVTKGHPHRLHAFMSPQTGPVGVLIEDRVIFHQWPRRLWRKALAGVWNNRTENKLPPLPAPVAIIPLSLGDHGGLLQALLESPTAYGYQGVILGLMGGGHAHADTMPLIEQLTAKMPVVGATRVGSAGGALLEKTYAIAGGEQHLAEVGVVSAGRLSPTKARILLGLLLAMNADRQAHRDVFGAIASPS